MHADYVSIDFLLINHNDYHDIVEVKYSCLTNEALSVNAIVLRPVHNVDDDGKDKTGHRDTTSDH